MFRHDTSNSLLTWIELSLGAQDLFPQELDIGCPPPAVIKLYREVSIKNYLKQPRHLFGPFQKRLGKRSIRVALIKFKKITNFIEIEVNETAS